MSDEKITDSVGRLAVAFYDDGVYAVLVRDIQTIVSEHTTREDAVKAMYECLPEYPKNGQIADNRNFLESPCDNLSD